MRYTGNKLRLVKHIKPIIESYSFENYIEPFAGTCSVIMNIYCKNKLANDYNKYIVALMKAIKDGWIPPENSSEEEYNIIKNNKDLYPDKLVGFLGFGCSFGGKFFGGYAKGGGRNYVAETQRSLLKIKDKLKGIEFSNKSYNELEIPDNSLIYCDPPYKGTYDYNTNFNHDAFYDWARQQSKKNIVLISEYLAPDDFECIWGKEVTSTLSFVHNKQTKIERLYKYKQNL